MKNKNKINLTGNLKNSNFDKLYNLILEANKNNSPVFITGKGFKIQIHFEEILDLDLYEKERINYSRRMRYFSKKIKRMVEQVNKTQVQHFIDYVE